MSNCVEKFGDKVDGGIASFFGTIGTFVGFQPRKTLIIGILLTVICGAGFLRWETENRGDKLWVPQDTTAEAESEQYDALFPSTSRFNTMIVQSSTSGSNVLEKATLVEAMKMHYEIETRESTESDETYVLTDLCTQAGGTCVSGSFQGVCKCLINSILKQWNYNVETLQNDSDYMTTLNNYGSVDDLTAILGNPTFDNGTLVAAEAFTLSYLLEDRSEVVDGSEVDPVNFEWEGQVFLDVAENSVPAKYPALSVDFLAGRSFEDEFGGEIQGDLLLVQVSYAASFLFLGATMGSIRCGTGSRWTMALAALITVGLSTAAGFGLSSAFGLFFGPVHSLLPFILLGIGVDDAFVIVNAFNRERKVKRVDEDNSAIGARASRALARAGASITVTSLTDLVAFGISSSSSLPALASFCAYAAISIFFLWLFASTFFSGCLVLDERRQRDNRRECVCCLTRKRPLNEEGEEDGYQEDFISRYFRNYHAPAILSCIGKGVVFIVFAGLLGFGFFGALNLSVEDSERAFIPADSYLQDYFEAADEFFPSRGIDLFFVFEGQSEIYNDRVALSNLGVERLTGLSTQSPWIAEPDNEESYRNVMTGLGAYLAENGSGAVGSVTLGSDGWPTNEEDFVATLKSFASFTGPGASYARDVSYTKDGATIQAIRVESEYVRLTKVNRGEIIDDADRQIEAMDDTRTLVSDWTDLQPAFVYSSKFLTIEGFKIIRRELFQNVGLAIGAVGIIVFLTVASPLTALIITVNVAFCIVEILGFMFALGIVIDSVSVINIVLAVGLSVDYSAHIGHCFMTKVGTRDERAKESLADIGAAVLSGAISTFLAVFVLLFSSSYVFVVLSRQFALTVALGIIHGLVLLPVLLSVIGPKPFSSATEESAGKEIEEEAVETGDSSGDEDPKKSAKTEADGDAVETKLDE